MSAPCHFIDDDFWRTVLSFAAGPSVHWNSAEGFAARRRAEIAVRAVASQVHAPDDVDSSFSEYAEAGRNFLKGLNAMTDFSEMMIDMCEPWNRNRPFAQQIFSIDLRKEIEKACRMLEQIQIVIDNSELDDGRRTGPNAKPFMHFGVGLLWELWADLNANQPRTKNDFLSFAEAVLHAAEAGVTRNSVLESYDRHVRPRLKAPPVFQSKQTQKADQA